MTPTAARRNSRKTELIILPLAPDFEWEIRLWQRGKRLVAGLDEAGRGAMAGPVSAGALVFPPDPGLQAALEGLNDSKKLSPAARAAWAHSLKEIALAWGVGMATSEEIDALGIASATRLAMVRALQAMRVDPEHLLIDFVRLTEVGIPQDALIKGDARSLSIAAASILAKTARDAWMEAYEHEHPGYGFAQHKGYGTAAHRAAMQRLGLSAIHRRSFQWRRAEAFLE